MKGKFGSGQLAIGELGCGMMALVLVLLAAGCAAPPPPSVDPETAQLSSSARAAYARGSYPQAARFYELALQRARAHDDGPEIARNAYNLAASQLAMGEPAAARAALREALAEFGRWRMDSQPALLLDAKAAQATGDADEARRVLDQALAACKSDAQRLQVWLVRGELAAAAGDRDGATAALREVEALAPSIKGAAFTAARLDLKGSVSLLAGEATPAAAAFDAAANAWQDAKQFRGMADALGRAGAAHLQAGDARTAADRFYRAARSQFSQGDVPGALRLAEQGLAACDPSADPDQQRLLEDLVSTITRAVARARAEALPAPSP